MISPSSALCPMQEMTSGHTLGQLTSGPDSCIKGGDVTGSRTTASPDNDKMTKMTEMTWCLDLCLLWISKVVWELLRKLNTRFQTELGCSSVI